MTFFLCKLWPYLLGGLIGWLLAGWFARRLKHSKVVEKVIEKEVETVVDNPEHLSLISKLKTENSKIPGLVTKIASFQSLDAKSSSDDHSKLIARIGELEADNQQITHLRSQIVNLETAEPKVIEKVVEVDNPVLLARIKSLEEENGQIAGLQGQISSLKSVEPKVIEKEVEKVVEVDNPELLARIKALEEENGQISSLQTKLSALENSEPQVVEKEVEKLIDNPKHLSRISDLEEQLEAYNRGPEIDLQAAKNAGIVIKDSEDLTAIEGIGPKINDLIKADGIQTFAALSDTSSDTIQKTLDNAGSKYQMANPGTWPDQANLAANNRWPALKALQDVLIGGVYPDQSKKTATSDTDSKAKNLTDNAEYISQISALEEQLEAYKRGPEIDLQAAKNAGIVIKDKDDLTAIEGIGPKINDLIKADGIQTFAALSDASPATIQKTLDNAGPRYQMANPGTWPDQANLAANNRWPALKALQDVLIGGVYPDLSNKASASKGAQAKAVVKLDTEAAKQAGFNIKEKNGEVDFTLIEGIGPKINVLIHEDGIHTFTDLADTKVEHIQEILDKAGSKFKLANPSTWPAQSDMAASNRWADLKAWQDELDGGV